MCQILTLKVLLCTSHVRTGGFYPTHRACQCLDDNAEVAQVGTGDGDVSAALLQHGIEAMVGAARIN